MCVTIANSGTLIMIAYSVSGARGSVIGWGTVLPAGRSPVRFPMRSLYFLTDLILPAALWSWGSIQPLTETSTLNLLGGKGPPVTGIVLHIQSVLAYSSASFNIVTRQWIVACGFNVCYEGRAHHILHDFPYNSSCRLRMWSAHSRSVRIFTVVLSISCVL
jgi:hypothetical protein